MLKPASSSPKAVSHTWRETHSCVGPFERIDFFMCRKAWTRFTSTASTTLHSTPAPTYTSVSESRCSSFDA